MELFGAAILATAKRLFGIELFWRQSFSFFYQKSNFILKKATNDVCLF